MIKTLKTLVSHLKKAPEKEFFVGNHVYKCVGDYKFEGIVIAKCTKLDGISVRYVVEDDRGALHIYSAKQLGLK